jgi:hypothetical protein
MSVSTEIDNEICVSDAIRTKNEEKQPLIQQSQSQSPSKPIGIISPFITSGDEGDDEESNDSEPFSFASDSQVFIL